MKRPCLLLFLSICIAHALTSKIASEAIHRTNNTYSTNNTNNTDTSLESEVQAPQSYSTNDRVTLRKCCPLGHVVSLDFNDMSTMSCAPTEETWAPWWYRKISETHFEYLKGSSGLQLMTDGHLPNCYNGTEISFFTPHPGEHYLPRRAEIRVTESGDILTRTTGNHGWEKPRKSKRKLTEMCIDGLVEDGSTAPFVSNNEQNQVLVFCMGPQKPKPMNYWWFLHLALLSVALVLLLVVVVTHVAVWRTQSISGWTVATYSFALFAFLTFETVSDNLRVLQKLSDDVTTVPIDHASCFFIGVMSQFWSIAKFSWMTVINFNMWSTIVSMKKKLAGEAERRRFGYYTLFGFGIPTLVVSISLFIEFHFGYFDDRVVRPQYGVARCDVDKTATLYHEIIVCAILFLTGGVICAFTLHFIINFMRRAKRFGQRNKRNRRYNLALMMGKIFILLAFSWIFEIAGMIVSFMVQKTIWWHVPLFDIHALIQAIGFFKMFVCNQELIDQLCNKYAIMEDLFAWLEEKKWFKRKEDVLTNSSSASRHSVRRTCDVAPPEESVA